VEERVGALFEQIESRGLIRAGATEESLSDEISGGRRRHWILEIHFVDRVREIGGFFEELLTV
jgi:hypothetical protein